MRKEEVTEVKNKPLKTDENRKLTFIHWILEKIFALCKEGRIESVKDAIFNIAHDRHHLFSQDIVINVLCVFPGCVPGVEAPLTGQHSYVEE